MCIHTNNLLSDKAEFLHSMNLLKQITMNPFFHTQHPHLIIDTCTRMYKCSHVHTYSLVRTHTHCHTLAATLCQFSGHVHSLVHNSLDMKIISLHFSFIFIFLFLLLLLQSSVRCRILCGL